MRFPALLALLLAAATITAGCGSLQGGARPGRPTAAPSSAPTPSPSAGALASPTATPKAQPGSPSSGQASPTAAGGTAGPAPATVPPTPAPPAASNPEVDGAVQAVLDYFAAINGREFSTAYAAWADGGAASGQTAQQFAQGYADTVQVTVLLGTPKPQGTGAKTQTAVPVTLMSVVNQPDQTQKLRHYQGSYILQPKASSPAGRWEIVSGAVAEVTGGPLPPAEVADPVVLLRSYFAAIDQRDFARAYSYWDRLGQASQQSFAQFDQGFAATKQVKADIGKPQYGAGAGNLYADLAVTIVATQNDGSTRRYSVSYTAHRANIPPFDQFGWRIYR